MIAALCFAAAAHGATYPQASQDWVRAFVSNQIQRAGSGGGCCGCGGGSSATATQSGCGCGATTADIEAYVRSYVASNAELRVTHTSTNGIETYTCGSVTATAAASTVPGIIVVEDTVLSRSDGLRTGRIFVEDENLAEEWSATGYSFYTTGPSNAWVIATSELGTELWDSDGNGIAEALTVGQRTYFVEPGGVATNYTPYVRVASTMLQPAQAARVIETGEL